MVEDKLKPDPLWLPEGSVRALAFIAVLGVSSYMVITGVPIQDWWKELVYGLVGFYFGTRFASKNNGGGTK